MFSGGNQSVLSATVSGSPSHGGEEEGEERSLSVVVENELGNSSEIVVVLQSEAEWVGGVLYCAVYIICHRLRYSIVNAQLVYCSLAAGLDIVIDSHVQSRHSCMNLRSAFVSE